MPSLARSMPKPLKVPSLARSAPKPLKVPCFACSVPKPLKVPSRARSVPKHLLIEQGSLRASARWVRASFNHHSNNLGLTSIGHRTTVSAKAMVISFADG